MSNYKTSYNLYFKTFSRPAASGFYTYASFPHSKINENDYYTLEPTEFVIIKEPTAKPSPKFATRCPSIPVVFPTIINKSNDIGTNETLIISICSVSFAFMLAAAFFYKYYYLKYKKRFEKLTEVDSDFGISSNELLN